MKKIILLTICLAGAASISLAGMPQIWTCPMHPQIRQSVPGTCPLCHMNLVLVSNNTNTPEVNTSTSARKRSSILDERRSAISKSGTENNSPASGAPDHESKGLQADTLSFEDVCSKEFPIAILSISKAVKAIESGDKRTELTELRKAVEKLLTVYNALDTNAKTQFANSLTCPIMGSPINPNTVSKNLIREYKGLKVAFCCDSCPPKWDKLNDTEKQDRLPKLKP
jgi:hypothetical protein